MSASEPKAAREAASVRRRGPSRSPASAGRSSGCPAGTPVWGAACIARQAELATGGDAPGFVEADRAFHRVFVAAAGNLILLGLHDSLRDRQARMGLAALARGTHRTEQILLEHRAPVDAVAARDEEAAHWLVDEHLGATLALLRGGPVG